MTAAFAATLPVAAARAYEPLGADFRISNAFTDGVAARGAFQPAIAYNSAANEFLVVWSADGLTTNDEFEISGQRLSATGSEIGTDFLISDTGPTVNDANRDASSPDVTYSSAANEYLVVWEGDDDPTVDDELEVHGQRVLANGTLGGGNFPVSDQGPLDDPSIAAVNPAVTHNPIQNRYLVVWQGGPLTGPNEIETFGQQLDAAGDEVGTDDFQISDGGDEGPDRQALHPEVAYGSGPDEYLVTWDGDGLAADNDYEIFGQRLESDGDEQGGDFRISTTGIENQTQRAALRPVVAYGSGPNEWLVAWMADALAVDGEVEIFGQRLNASGAEVGANDFQISTTGADGSAAPEAYNPAAAYGATGNEYLVSWSGDGVGADEFEISGQRLSTSGTDIGGDFRISTTGTDGDATRDADEPALAFGSGPNAYLSAWEADDLATDNELEIFGRLIGKPAASTPGPGPGTTNPACKKPKKKKKKKRAALAKKKKKKKKGCGKKKKRKKK